MRMLSGQKTKYLRKILGLCFTFPLKNHCLSETLYKWNELGLQKDSGKWEEVGL